MWIPLALGCVRHVPAPIASAPTETPAAPEPTAEASVLDSLCEAVRARAAYVVAHPDMEPYADVLAFGSLAVTSAEDRKRLAELVAKDEPCGTSIEGLELERLLVEPLATDPPCPEGSRPYDAPTVPSGITPEGVEHACLLESRAPGTVQYGGSAGVFAAYSGWRTIRRDGKIVVQGSYDEQGRQTGEWEFAWTAAGDPVLERVRTYHADGRMDGLLVVDELRRWRVRVAYDGPWTEARRVTWLTTGASTTVRIAEAEGNYGNRTVREWVVLDGLVGPEETWVAAANQLAREPER